MKAATRSIRWGIALGAALVAGDVHGVGSGAPLTPEEAHRLVRDIWVLSARWEQAPIPYSRDVVEYFLGPNRSRAMSVARFEHRIHTDPFTHDGRHPDELEEVEDMVLGAYLKLQRKSLEQALGLDEWLERRRSRFSSDDNGTPSWRPRISPQVDVGSSPFLGVRLSLPRTGRHFWNHLSLRVGHGFEDDGMSYVLKFDDGARHFFLEHETGGRDGDRLSFNVRMWF